MELKEKNLNQILEFLKNEHLSIMNVCFFMQQIRLLLEINNSKEKYKITNHYCDWLLHKKLDRRKSKDIINEISSHLQNFKTKNELIKNVNNSLSLKKLVKEIKDILYENIENKRLLIYSNTYFSDKYWVVFIRIILNQILLRPLVLKSNYISIEDFSFNVNGIQFVSDKDKIFLEMLSDELKIKEKRILIEIALLYGK